MAAEPPSLFVRSVEAADWSQVDEILLAAFGRSAEGDLVRALRADEALTAELVAGSGARLLGHAAFSPVEIVSGALRRQATALGPLAVRPEAQGLRIGSRLVRDGLGACAAAGFDLVFVLGHPAYYARFGFARADAFGFVCEFAAPPEAFMVAELAPAAAAGLRGTVRYRPEFSAV